MLSHDVKITFTLHIESLWFYKFDEIIISDVATLADISSSSFTTVNGWLH